MKKRIISILIAVVIFCLAFTACTGNKATEGNAPSDNSSAEAGVFGEFVSYDMKGKKVDHTALQGKKLTMVNAWATFCGPCISEMPDLQKISKEYEKKDFQIVGLVVDVSVDETGKPYNESLYAEAEKVIKDTGVKYTNILLSDSLKSSEAGSIYTIPTTYFLDENGNKIGETYIGSRSYEDWCQIIDSLLIEE